MALIDTIRTNLNEIGLVEMQRLIGKEFYQMRDVVEALFVGVSSGKNIILYGLGGFGKTQIVKRFLQLASIKQTTIVGYEDMDVEALLGIPDMNKLMEHSEYHISFEKTAFMTEGVMVLEEFLDVNPKTAIALKDILTENGYRQGNEFTESKISSYIICTNKAPSEMNTDNSTTAFYHERFPIKKEVVWANYSYNRYRELIKVLVGNDQYDKGAEHYRVLAELCSRTSSISLPVSPRIVKDALDLLHNNNFNIMVLTHLDGINTDILPQVQEACRLRDEDTRIKDLSRKVTEFINNILADHSQTGITANISKISYIKESLKSYPVANETNINTIAHLRDLCDRSQIALWKYFNNFHVIDTKEIDEFFK